MLLEIPLLFGFLTETENHFLLQLGGLCYILSIICRLFSFIAFIMWFKRAYYNLRQKVSDLSYLSWVVAGWLVPIVNLYRPYQMMKQLYVKTKNFLIEKSYSDPSTAHLGWWWGIWIISPPIIPKIEIGEQATDYWYHIADYCFKHFMCHKYYKSDKRLFRY